jgi:hypothetical protein
MNASKRKFNALLSSLGNRSSTSLSSKSGTNNGSAIDLAAEGDVDMQSKKRRVDRLTSALNHNPTSLKSATSSVKAAHMAHTKAFSLSSASLATTDTPRYAPWDRAAFLKRLETFRIVTDWTPKPEKVNEVEWAKRGWVCKGFERVRCEMCNIEILVKLNVREVDGEEKRVLEASDIGRLAAL